MKQNFTNALTANETNLTAEEYAFKQIQADIGEEDPAKAASFIMGEIAQQYLCLIGGDEEHAANFGRMAEALWRNYMNHLPAGKTNADRITLPPLEKLRDNELEQMESQLSPQLANYLRNLLGKPPRAPASPPAPAAGERL